MYTARLSPLRDAVIGKPSVNSANSSYAYDPKLSELPMGRVKGAERHLEARTGRSCNSFG